MNPRRLPWALALPVLVLLAWRVAPLASGRDTLFVRDVFNTHLGLQHARAEAFAAGALPLVDPRRAGGQPLLGNLNAAPLYPDGLLLLAAPLLWAVNAHFWLHWLLAPFALYALGRALGLAPPAAWAAGACYALSGFFVSQLSFFNLIAGAALAPALAAASIAAVRAAAAPRRRAASIAGAGLGWTLLVLGGDPPTALVALALGLSAVLARPLAAGERRRPPLGRALALAAALAAGTLLALPQIAATAQILPGSLRGVRGYSEAARTVGSFDPRQALEWLLPFAFGRPDVTGDGAFWGFDFYTGAPPYFFTLYPGLLALALVAAAGRPRGAAAWWGWAAVAGGLFVALGRFNPLAAWLFGLGPAAALRYPVKAWLAVAVGASVLCGLGFARALAAPRAGRRLVAALAALAAVFGAGWALFALAPEAAEGWLRGLVPARLPDAFVAAERLRWAGLCRLSAAVAAALAGAAWLFARSGRPGPGRSGGLEVGQAEPGGAGSPDGRRNQPDVGGAAGGVQPQGGSPGAGRPAGEERAPSRLSTAGAALLLTVHAAAQLVLLAPAMPTDAAAAYREPSPLLAAVPPGALVAHGAAGGLFGGSTLHRGAYPDPGVRWLERRAFFELYPVAGRLWGRRYALDVSAEGLDSYFTRLARAAIEEAADDGERVRLLAAWGVDRLLLDRPLGAEAESLARPVAAASAFGSTARVYALAGAAPEVAFATEIERAPHLNAARDALRRPGFDPRRRVVLAGEPAAAGSDPGAAGPSPPSASLAAEPAGAGSGGRAPALPSPAARAPAVRVLARGPESVAAEVDAPRPGVLVWRRAWLPLYRASVDGAPAAPVVANLHHLGVEVPAGRHAVRVWADRGPLARAAWGALAGAALLAALALGAARGRW